MKEWRVYAKDRPDHPRGIIITFPAWDEPGAREWFKEHQTTKPGHFYEGMTLELVEFETREERIEKSLRGLLAAKEATNAYMAKIPDGCSADPDYLGRLVRNETKAEDTARAALN